VRYFVLIAFLFVGCNVAIAGKSDIDRGFECLYESKTYTEGAVFYDTHNRAWMCYIDQTATVGGGIYLAKNRPFWKDVTYEMALYDERLKSHNKGSNN